MQPTAYYARSLAEGGCAAPLRGHGVPNTRPNPRCAALLPGSALFRPLCCDPRAPTALLASSSNVFGLQLYPGVNKTHIWKISNVELSSSELFLFSSRLAVVVFGSHWVPQIVKSKLKTFDREKANGDFLLKKRPVDFNKKLVSICACIDSRFTLELRRRLKPKRWRR